jgi:hypothetical protein
VGHKGAAAGKDIDHVALELSGTMSGGEIGILEPTRHPGHQDAARRDANSGQHPNRALLREQQTEFAIQKRRQQRAKNTRDADGNGIGDRKPDLADGDPEGRSADSIMHP